jgi:hypothetical protein
MTAGSNFLDDGRVEFLNDGLKDHGDRIEGLGNGVERLDDGLEGHGDLQGYS